MFWYDVHFVFSNKIFKRYDIDEISPYSNINFNPKMLAHYTNDESILTVFFKNKCRNFIVSSI